jgi:transposase-like protein
VETTTSELIPAAETERMMKVQEVILRAMAGSLKWWEAAEILGVTDRTMRRWRQRYQEHGYSGLYDYRKRQPSPKRIAVEMLERVLPGVSGPVLRLQRAAFPREAARGARHRAELHLGEAGATKARGW